MINYNFAIGDTIKSMLYNNYGFIKEKGQFSHREDQQKFT